MGEHAQYRALVAALAPPAGRGAAAGRAECGPHPPDRTGDGRTDAGPRLREMSDGTGRGDALVIGIGAARAPDHTGNDLGALTADFRAEGIRGPDAFVETALGFADFEVAMLRKRLRALQNGAVGRLLLHDPGGRGGQTFVAPYLDAR